MYGFVKTTVNFPGNYAPGTIINTSEPRLYYVRGSGQASIENPLGACAMYLGSSLYRIHGSNEAERIGQCLRAASG